MFGSLTIPGSLMAFGKLQELVKSAPVTYRGQNTINLTMFAVAVGLFAYLIVQPGAERVFYGMVGLGLVNGVFLVLPSGVADMPVVISLLYYYACLSSAASYFHH